MNQKITQYTVDLDSAVARQWDVIVVGAGMGGGTAASALAKKGLNVLLIDKGKADFSESPKVSIDVETLDPEERLKQGRWPTQLKTIVDGSESNIWAPLGCGVGGSSLLYAAALSRLEPVDFESRPGPDGRMLSWPISYQELEPYYEQSEALFNVCGTPDPREIQSPWPLQEPPQMSPVDQHFVDKFEEHGLSPYALHAGVKYAQPDCEGCGGHLCQFECKQSSAQSCVIPGLETGKLWLLEYTEVVKIDADRETVQRLVVAKNAQQGELQAAQYVLAAGAYFSPIILQRSTNAAWPKGLANDNDLVGRNLMFHISEHIGIWPKGKHSSKGPRKTISLRDFYEVDGKKYGEFQSTGITAGYGNILFFLRTVLDQSKLRYIPLLRKLLALPAFVGSMIFKEATVFACIMEDFPYLENRIVVDESAPSGIRVEYTIHDELRSRVKSFRKLLRQRVKSLFMYPMTNGIWLNYGHPCGTLRAGEDPQISVVDKNCKFHSIDNLYVADSSFMPTSGGSNPSLTIAANALRVADTVANRLQK